MSKINIIRRLNKGFKNFEESYYENKYLIDAYDELKSIFHTLKYFKAPDGKKHLIKLNSYSLKDKELKKYILCHSTPHLLL